MEDRRDGMVTTQRLFKRTVRWSGISSYTICTIMQSVAIHGQRLL